MNWLKPEKCPDPIYNGFLLASYDIDLLKPHFNNENWRTDHKFNEIKYKTILNNQYTLNRSLKNKNTAEIKEDLR